jgi:hypothetical protein
MAYEWSLIPYPHLRAINLFNAFILTAISVGIVTAFSIETQAYFVRKEEKRTSFEVLERENNIAGIHYPGDNIKRITKTTEDPYDYHMAFHRAIRVSIVSALITFTVYLVMYFFVGFGGGMVSMNRKWRMFSSIPAKKG